MASEKMYDKVPCPTSTFCPSRDEIHSFTVCSLQIKYNYVIVFICLTIEKWAFLWQFGYIIVSFAYFSDFLHRNLNSFFCTKH